MMYVGLHQGLVFFVYIKSFVVYHSAGGTTWLKKGQDVQKKLLKLMKLVLVRKLFEGLKRRLGAWKEP